MRDFLRRTRWRIASIRWEVGWWIKHQPYFLRLIGGTVAILIGFCLVAYVVLSLLRAFDLEIEVLPTAAIFFGGAFLSGFTAYHAFKSGQIGGGQGYVVRGGMSQVLAVIVLTGGLFAAYGAVRLVIEVASGDVDYEGLETGLYGCIGAYVVAGILALPFRKPR